MAIGIKRIEKEFLLKSIFDEQVPVTMQLSGGQENLTIADLKKDAMLLKAVHGLPPMKKGHRLSLFFKYREQVINFVATVKEAKDAQIWIDVPESLYKNLSRKYARIPYPPDIDISFSYRGERFELSYPKTDQFEPVETPQYAENFDPSNIRDLVEQFNQKAEIYGDEHKITMFRENPPVSVEEKIIARYGKTYFLPSTMAELPSVDPYIKKKLITKSMMETYLGELSRGDSFAKMSFSDVIKEKRKEGVLGELLCPIIFQEYVIGYILIRNNKAGKPPFDLNLVDSLTQLAKILAYSLKINGYFKNAQIKQSKFGGSIIDISASGVLFANSQAVLAQSLLEESEIDLTLKTKKREISVSGKIMRRSKDATNHYYGVDFRNMKPEDLRFIFELLYGRPFKDSDARFLEGGIEAKNPIFG